MNAAFDRLAKTQKNFDVWVVMGPKVIDISGLCHIASIVGHIRFLGQGHIVSHFFEQVTQRLVKEFFSSV